MSIEEQEDMIVELEGDVGRGEDVLVGLKGRALGER